MGLHYPIKWITLASLAMLTVFPAGCSDAASMIRETEQGGVVTYVFKDDRGGPMGSPHRKDALKMIDRKCPFGYTVVQDGEVRGYGSMSSVEGQEGEVAGRRWGVQFRCK